MPDEKLDDVATLATRLADELLADSRAALGADLYEVAYHALAAALHGAEAARDAGRLRAIHGEATRQQNEVDARAPNHRLSRNSGRQRAHGGWFDALAIQATSVLSRQHAASALEWSATQRLQARARDDDSAAPPKI